MPSVRSLLQTVVVVVVVVNGIEMGPVQVQGTVALRVPPTTGPPLYTDDRSGEEAISCAMVRRPCDVT